MRKVLVLEDEDNIRSFVVINLKRAVRFDLRITGTVQIRLDDGTSAYVSRRYVGKIKQLLGV